MVGRGARARRWFAAGLVTGAVSLATPGPVAAQWSAIQQLEVGDSVRVRLRGALRVNASMAGLRADTLLLTVVGLPESWPVSGYDLVSLERFGERNRQEGLRNGMILGVVAGLFVGSAIGATRTLAGENEGDVQRVVRGTLRWGGVFAVGGGVIGAVRGSRNPGLGWLHMEVPSR